MAKNLEISLLLDFYGDMLTLKQKNMIQYYYDNDLSLAEIAQNEGITRQGVRDNIKRAEGQLMEMEARLGLARRFKEMAQGLGSIKKAAFHIRELNDKHTHLAEIDNLAKEIEDTASRLGD